MVAPYCRKRQRGNRTWKFRVGLAAFMMCSTAIFCKSCRQRLSSGLGRKPSTNGPSNDLWSMSAWELQDLLGHDIVTSTELVQQGQRRIQQHDGYLKAMLALAPHALQEAHGLDQERRQGRLRGPLHGIPILIKDNVATHPAMGMNTTAGSFALMGSRPGSNAIVVERLLTAGTIIMGKTQLSEWAMQKGTGLPSGWSAVGGQTQSAYTRDDVQLDDGSLGYSNPGGSSSGSAVGISGGYAPISIGTDTTGSVIFPASRAALYGIRVTTGLVPMQGVIPISKTFDTLGVMARSVKDLANLLDVLIDPSDSGGVAGRYAAALPGDWNQLRIGVVDPEKWFLPASLARPNPAAHRQMVEEAKEACENLRRVCKRYQEVDLVTTDVLNDSGEGIFDLLEADFKGDLESYLTGLESSRVRTLAEIVDFNDKHADEELPIGYTQQDRLTGALNSSMSAARRTALLSHVRHASREGGIDNALDENQVDVIIGPADSPLHLLICASGYPSAAMPLSQLDFNGAPFGLVVFTRAHGEDMLLKVLSAWEKTFAPKEIPLAL